MSERAPDRLAERTRLAALLALNAPRGSPETAQGRVDRPSDDDLAALLDGRLTGAERERVLRGIAAHPEAYRAWLAAAAEARAGSERRAERRLGPARPAVRRWLATGGMAAAALAGTIGWWVWAPAPLDREIGSGLIALSGYARPLPQSFASLGLAGRGGTDAQAEAAVAGYRSGLAALGTPGVAAGETPAGEGQAAYRLGRWVALLEAAAVAEPPPGVDLWADQVRIGDRLAAEIGVGDLARELGLLNTALGRRGEGGAAWRRDLAQEVWAVRLRLGLDWAGSARAP